MSKFTSFTHLEEKVEAIQLTPESQATVVKALANEAYGLLLTRLSIELDTEVNCFSFIFRYKTDSVESTLTMGNYLVRLNAGNYVVREKAAFEAEYMNTGADVVLPIGEQKTVTQTVLDQVAEVFPTMDLSAGLTEDVILQVAEKQKPYWYDSALNVVNVKMSDAGIVDPEGLGNLLSVAAKASYVNDQTKFSISFDNGDNHGSGRQTYPNQFNMIALMEIVGELRSTGELAKRLASLSFRRLTVAALSPIANSVTSPMQDEFYDALRVIAPSCKVNF